jgi:hypothetical protein
MNAIVLVLGFFIQFRRGACLLLVAFAAISSGLWGLGHIGPILLIGIPALALGIVCLLFGAKTTRTAQS